MVDSVALGLLPKKTVELNEKDHSLSHCTYLIQCIPF